MKKMIKFGILVFLISVNAMAQRGAGEQLKQLEKEKKIAEDEANATNREKRNVASVTAAQKELDDFLFTYIAKIDSSSTNKESADSVLKLIEDEARKAAQNSYFSKCNFNSLRSVAVINRIAEDQSYNEIRMLSERLSKPLSVNYDGKIVPIWFYSVYKASLGIDDKLERMKYLNQMAYIAKDSIKTKVFNEYFIGKMIKRMLVKERTLFNEIYAEYKLAKDQIIMTDALCAILTQNGMYKDLAYALWVFQPLLGEKVESYSGKAIENLAMTSDPEKDELEVLFKGLNSK